MQCRVTPLRVIAWRNVFAVADLVKTPLSERIEMVCRARGYENEREWCFAAEYSAGYLATLRNRAKNAATFRLPEKVAVRLAKVARISVEWLRDGVGEMELPAAVTAAVPEAVELALLDAIRATGCASEDGVAARAIVAAGARFVPADRGKASEVLSRLLGAVRDARAAGLQPRPEVLLWVLLGAFPSATRSRPSSAAGAEDEAAA